MSPLTRRELLAASAATIGGAALAGPSLASGLDVQAGANGLHAVAQKRGLRYGSCFAMVPPQFEGPSVTNPKFTALLERDCGVLVCENEMKWQAVRPDAARFDFSRPDPMAAYAKKIGAKLRGHTLLWHKVERFPGWLVNHDFGPRPAEAAEKMLSTHIKTIVDRYAGQIYSWDVVNETVDEDTGAQRESSLSRAYGSADTMCDRAFHLAREYAPGVQLVYNDYMSWEGDENHRTGVLKLLEGFKKRGVPCDALGLQSHIWVSGEETVAQQVRRQEKGWRTFLDEAVAMGYKLEITEMDVNDKRVPADIAARDAKIADYVKAYLDVTLSYSQITDVLSWGMTDRYFWLNGFDPRTDGGQHRGLPYDADFKPKPLYHAIERALAAAPIRG